MIFTRSRAALRRRYERLEAVGRAADEASSPPELLAAGSERLDAAVFRALVAGASVAEIAAVAPLDRAAIYEAVERHVRRVVGNRLLEDSFAVPVRWPLSR